MDTSESIVIESDPEIIVRADEIDETGADVSVLSAATDAELTSQVEERNQDVADIGAMPSMGDKPASPMQGEMRPILRREGQDPLPLPPPNQPPPPAPARRDSSGASAGAGVGVGEGPLQDSLSLAQLRNIMSNSQRIEPTAYAYTYEDTRTFAEEIEEWFQYSVEDRDLLRSMRTGFESVISKSNSPLDPETWADWPLRNQKDFVSLCLTKLRQDKANGSLIQLQALGYVALGAWKSSAKKSDPIETNEEADFEAPNDHFKRSVAHIHSVRKSAKLLDELNAIEVIYDRLQSSLGSADDERSYTEASDEQSRSEASVTDICLTILYTIIEAGRWFSCHEQDDSLRDTFCRLEPSFLNFLCQQIARVRWDEDHDLHLTRAIQLLWKGMLLILGSSEVLSESKKVLTGYSDKEPNGKPQSLLTTTPLDYHMFRQEIISKYPAYNPPPPLVPLEPDNTSLLPPLPRTARSDSVSSLDIAPAKFNKSIFEQPVHITTPIPSPPPSPAGPGGKGGKKQNYQTNQNFPFLYPPSDTSNNNLGGKGGLSLHDKLVGKRWEGSDVPASILEAGELFASRMRMSRATRQLWEAREACIKYDRGWAGGLSTSRRHEDLDGDIQELKLDASSDEEKKESGDEEEEEEVNAKLTPESSDASVNAQETNDPAVQRRLDLADAFYRGAIPHLQSIVIVVLKILLANISATGGQGGSSQPSPALPQFPLERDVDEARLPRANINLVKQLSSVSNGAAPPQEDGLGSSAESLNSLRTREITSKAISGMLLTMLKWFRFSHVLKFQFLTQLLLDSNYLPLALKYFAMQDVDRSVDRKTDNEKLGFFEFCREDAGIKVAPEEPGRKENGGPAVDGAAESSDEGEEDDEAADEAQPPPIRRRRSEEELTGPSEDSPPPSPPGSPGDSGSGQARKPEVDELGYPTGPLPQQPLTTYSARFFLTTIAMLRVLQKISKGHAHRALLLVQYKSSTILRKALKIPQPALRLYTLKLFKSQVPFCGRKWRQANMRVITAIYVFCRMGLRDDWISGAGAVDDWVESALATEQGWRGLTGWWHSRFYRDAVGVDKLALEDGEGGDNDDDEDFFARELEKMGWADHGLDGMAEEEQDDWEGGLLQPEGW